jgi:hypothetical protein
VAGPLSLCTCLVPPIKFANSKFKADEKSLQPSGVEDQNSGAGRAQTGKARRILGASQASQPVFGGAEQSSPAVSSSVFIAQVDSIKEASRGACGSETGSRKELGGESVLMTKGSAGAVLLVRATASAAVCTRSQS